MLEIGFSEEARNLLRALIDQVPAASEREMEPARDSWDRSLYLSPMGMVVTLKDDLVAGSAGALCWRRLWVEKP